MSTGEFDLIGRYFSIQKGNQHFVDFSIGDDCAITHIPEGYQLAITTDTMVEGTHFLSSISLPFVRWIKYPVISLLSAILFLHSL